MKSWRIWMAMVCAVVAAVGFSACDRGGGGNGDSDAETNTEADTTSGSSETNAAASAETTAATTAVTVANTSLTGDWLFKHEVMRLQQSGASLQGAVYAGAADPADPVEVPVPVVGSVRSDGVVRMSELINYLNDPSRNYTIDKVGGLRDANTLVLQVTRGQTPQTQTWTRK